MKSFDEIRNSLEEGTKSLTGFHKDILSAMGRGVTPAQMKKKYPNISMRAINKLYNQVQQAIWDDEDTMVKEEIKEKKFSFGAPESVVLDKVEKMIANTKNAPEAYKLIANKMKVTDAMAKKLVNKVIDRSLKGKKK